jgi:hypothetical protein
MFSPRSLAASGGSPNADLPPGRHLVTVTDAGLFVASTGSSAVEVTFEVADTASPLRGRAHEREKFWLSKRAAFRLVNLCIALDPDFPEFDEGDPSAIFTAFVGRSVALTIAPARDAAARRPVEAHGFDPLTPEERAQLGPVRPARPRSAMPPKAFADVPPPGDDDISF